MNALRLSFVIDVDLNAGYVQVDKQYLHDRETYPTTKTEITSKFGMDLAFYS